MGKLRELFADVEKKMLFLKQFLEKDRFLPTFSHDLFPI